MDSTAADLSSIGTMLTDLVERLDKASAGMASHEREDLAGELLEIQRLLEAANRRLARLMRAF